MNQYTLSEQLSCVRRELALRKAAYPKWVASKRMGASVAEHEINCMQAVHATLTALIELEREPTP